MTDCPSDKICIKVKMSMKHWCKNTDKRTPKYLYIHFSPYLDSKNLTWNILGWNPGFHIDKTVRKILNHGTVYWPTFTWIVCSSTLHQSVRTCTYTSDSYENRHKIVIWKPNGRKTTSRLDHKNKMALKKIFGVCRVDWLALDEGRVVVFCEQGNELLHFIKGWVFLMDKSLFAAEQETISLG